MDYFTFILKIFVILLGYTKISCIFVKEITTKTIEIMKTFKLNFINTSNNLDFVLIYANNEGEAINLFVKEANADCMLSIENVTGKFVDFKR